MRARGTNCRGGCFSSNRIDAVWKKGKRAIGRGSGEIRLDACGGVMVRGLYGKIEPGGWEIDHVFPISLANEYGIPVLLVDRLENLQPLLIENNRRKADNFPQWECAVPAGKVISAL